MMKKDKVKKILKWTGITLGSLFALGCIALVIVLNTLFNSEKLTPMVEKIAKEHINSDIKIKGVELTFFSTFPDLSVKIDTLVVAQLNDSISPLIYSESCYASINPMALLNNEIEVNGITLEGADINVYVDSLIGPLKVFKLPTDTIDTDTTSTGDAYALSLDQIKIRHSSITIDDRTRDFYSKLDSMSLDLSASFFPEQVDFDMVADLPDITIRNQNETLANNESLMIDALMSYTADSMKFTITRGDLKVNTIDLKTSGTVVGDTINKGLIVDLFTTLSTPSIGEFVRLIPRGLIDHKESLHTDGIIDLALNVKGEYNDSIKPLITADLDIEKAKAKFDSRKMSIENIDCKANIFIDPNRPKDSYAAIHKFKLNASDIIDLSLNGRLTNLLVDPFLDLNISSDIDFNRFTELFPLKEGVTFKGKNKSDLALQMSLSDIEKVNYGQFYINGESKFTDIIIAIDGQTYTGDSTSTGSLDVNIKHGNILFGDNVRSDNNSRTLLSNITLTNFAIKDKTGQFVNVQNLHLTAGANFDKKSQSVNGVGVAVDALNVDYGIENMLDLDMKSSFIKFTLSPKSETQNTRITGTLSSDSISAFEQVNNSQIEVSKANIDFELNKKAEKVWNRQGTVGFSDLSLRTDAFPLDILLTQSKLKIDNNVIRLSNTRLKVGESSMVATGSISNLFVALFSQARAKERPIIEGRLNVQSPQLNLTELIEATNQGVMLNDSTYSETDSTAVQTIEVKAPVVKTKTPKQEKDSSWKAQRKHRRDSIKQTRDAYALTNGNNILIPKNINFDLNLNLQKVIYEGGSFDSVVGKAKINNGVLTLNQLTLQTIGAQAKGSMVYKNMSRTRSKVLLELQLDGVDINRIGELLPTIDTLMPMINSFEGSVDMNLKASGMVNRKTGFSLPTLRAAVDMKGRELVLMDSETFKDLSKLLMFKNKERNLIDSLEINIIADSSRVDVLPFNVAIDRYKAIVGGTQLVDTSFNIDFEYNVSIMKSPLPFKAGVDIVGNQDDYEYNVTRAKLKHTDFAAIQQQFIDFRESIEDQPEIAKEPKKNKNQKKENKKNKAPTDSTTTTTDSTAVVTK